MKVLSELLGGLALFLYGMGVMSDSLKLLAGGRLPSVLSAVTKSRFRGFISGLGVTALIQSSSAVSVMLIGLVNSGLLSFASTFGVIMGSNVGTTVTAWLVSLNDAPAFLTVLKPSVFAPILAFFAMGLIMLSHSDKAVNVGRITVGFAILIIGMELMSDATSFIKDSDAFSDILIMFSNPLIAVAVGALFTAIIQSSSASIGILQAFAATGGITFSVAIPLVLGANIGTCVTGLIAAVGGVRDAKRVAVLQCYFNLFGVAVFLLLLLFIKLPSLPVGAVEIALLHTGFNLLTALIITPFYKLVIRITEKTVR